MMIFKKRCAIALGVVTLLCQVLLNYQFQVNTALQGYEAPIQPAMSVKSAFPVATTAPTTSTVSANVTTKDEFCSACIWDNKITCQARADYLARKYFNHDKDAALQSILADPMLKQCHRLPTCIIAPYPSGWGNAVYNVLYHLVTQQNHQRLPCVRGYGGLFGKLFSNIAPCLAVHDDNFCMKTKEYPDVAWRKIINRVRQHANTPLKSPLMVLNGTFVKEVLAQNSLTVEELQSSCAVHVRFGDFFIRKNGTNAYDRRVCRKLDDESACFEEVAKKVRKKCPELLTPLYLASDNLGFVRYFIAAEPNRTVLPYAGKNMDHKDELIIHVNDLGSVNVTTSHSVQVLLRDWLALALADTASAIARSTFSSSAKLGFSLSDNDNQ